MCQNPPSEQVKGRYTRQVSSYSIDRLTATAFYYHPTENACTATKVNKQSPGTPLIASKIKVN